MTTRGVYKKNIEMKTCTLLGAFDADERVRDSFFRMIGFKPD
jgi:GTP cyclohydrolase I